jgi:threonine/homoserine/homoserine lactone efflux protein
MFGITDYGAFCAAVLLFLALPGPGTFALLTSTAKGGFRAGAAATAGVIVGDQVLMWLAVAGVAALLAAHPSWFRAIQYAGAAYLAWIGLLITLLNPKAIVFYMAFFPLFIDPSRHQGMVTFTAMAVTIAGITAAYCLVLCALAGLVTEKVRSHKRLARWMERAAGVFLIGFGLKLGSS